MICPGCGHDLDPTAYCDGCGLQLSVAEELRLRAAMPDPRTKAIQDDKIDMALREGGG